MQQVKKGDKVRVHYHGKLNDGSTFDSSEGRDPLEFTVGAGQVIKGFDDAVMDMTPGDKKTVNIPSHEAYGERSDDMLMEYPLDDFPEDIKPQEGMELQMSDEQGHIFPVLVHEVKENSVVLDGNPPLAGKDLTFDIELVSIGE